MITIIIWGTIIIFMLGAFFLAFFQFGSNAWDIVTDLAAILLAFLVGGIAGSGMVPASWQRDVHEHMWPDSYLEQPAPPNYDESNADYDLLTIPNPAAKADRWVMRIEVPADKAAKMAVPKDAAVMEVWMIKDGKESRTIDMRRWK